MSYRHIDNLYKAQEILLFREVFATEKIHGTSAHVKWRVKNRDEQIATVGDGGVTHRIIFFSGGCSHEQFVALFNEQALVAAFEALGHDEVTVYGEAYGGKLQGMSSTYGKELRFVAFEVQVGETWLNVENAADVVAKLGLEFVHFKKIPTDLSAINAERDAESVQAIRNGMGPGHLREGIVLRPLLEFRDHRGDRIIAKHKADVFKETKTPREVDPVKAKVLADADAIAMEWVTEMRLRHVLDSVPLPYDLQQTGLVIRLMTEDVLREGAGEFVDTKDARKAIGSRVARLFKKALYGSTEME